MPKMWQIRQLIHLQNWFFAIEIQKQKVQSQVFNDKLIY